MNKRKAILPALGFIFVLFFCCYTYYHEELFMNPSLIHAWAQADRLALAIAFYDNGMNFFKPATLSQWSIDGVVGVEFPIQAYLAAAVAHIFGRDSISVVFRLLNTIISCIGLFFLFRACYKHTRDFAFSLIPPLFIFCSPVFIFYTCNYLPDTAGVSMAFIGFYYVLSFLESKQTKWFLLAVFFLTLGTLIKTSIVTYLLGFFGVVIIHIIRHRKAYSLQFLFRIFSVSLVSIVVLASNYLYVGYLNKKHNSFLFNTKPIPFENWDDFNYYINERFKNLWINDYFVLPQYLFFVALLSTAFAYMVKDKIGRDYLLLLLFYLLGSSGIFYLLGHQMGVHDYYIISIFQPGIAFAILASVIMIRRNIHSYEGLRPVRIAFVSSVLIMFFFADFQIHKRLRPEYLPHSLDYRTSWLDKAASVVNALNIQKNERILVLNEEAPNLSLVYFDRKGIVLPEINWAGDPNNIYFYMNQHHIKWMLIEKQNYNDLILENPKVFEQFRHKISMGRIEGFLLREVQN